MMLSGTEGCGCDVPAVPRTGLSGHYYNPNFRISGSYGYVGGYHSMAGIVESGPYPRPVEAAKEYCVFVGKMNLREEPSLKGKKTGKQTAINEVYKIKAKSWGSAGTEADMKVGDSDRLWYLLLDPSDDKTLLGWACAVEATRTAADTVIKIAYALPDSQENAKLSDDELKQYTAAKKENIAAVKKWKAANLPPARKAAKDPKDATAEEDSSGGLGMGATVAIGLGAAAVVYFLILKGKKK